MEWPEFPSHGPMKLPAVEPHFSPKIDVATVSRMESSSQLRKLSAALNSGEEGQLYLAWCKDSGETPTPDGARRFLDNLEKNCKDTSFCLRKYRLGTHSALCLAGLLDKVYLTKLDLSMNALRDHGCQTLGQLIRESPHLAHVNLGGNDIGSTGAAILATAIPLANALKTLILGCDARHVYANHIDSDGGRLIAESISRSPSLEVLDLSSNPLGAQHQGAFEMLAASMTSCRTLRVLKTGCTQMSASSAAALLRACASSSVTALDLSDNNLPPSVCAVAANLLSDGNGEAKKGGLPGSRAEGWGADGAASAVGSAARSRPTTGQVTLPAVGAASGAEGGSETPRRVPTRPSTSPMAVPPLSPSSPRAGTAAPSANGATGPSGPPPAPVLEDLDLSGNPRMGGKGGVSIFGALAWAQPGTSLKRLSMSRCALGTEGAAHAAHALATNRCLTSLSLAENGIDVDGGLALAAALGQGTSLTKLDLHGNVLGSIVARAIAKELSYNAQLQVLELSDCRIDDDGAVALAVAVLSPETLVSHIHLAGNFVSDEGGSVVAEMVQKTSRLLTFDLTRNHVCTRSLERINQLTSANRSAVTDAVPRKLQQDLIKLHYAQVKLMDAKHALQHQVTMRQELVKKGEQQDAEIAAEKEEHSKRSKELVDRIVAEEELMKDVAAKRKRRIEEKEKLRIKFDVDMQALGKQLTEESKKAAEAAEQLEAAKKQLGELETEHTRRLAELQQDIVKAKQERQQWRRMSAEYYRSVIEVNKVISKLNEAVNVAETAAHERDAENLRKSKARSAKEGAEALAAFLAANSS